MIGFSNFNEFGELEYANRRAVEEYQLDIDKGLLTMRRKGVETFEFRKLAKTEFPRKALRALEFASETDIFDEDF